MHIWTRILFFNSLGGSVNGINQWSIPYIWDSRLCKSHHIIWIEAISYNTLAPSSRSYSLNYIPCFISQINHYMSGRVINFVSVSAVFRLNFGNVLTAWYVLYFSFRILIKSEHIIWWLRSSFKHLIQLPFIISNM